MTLAPLLALAIAGCAHRVALPPAPSALASRHEALRTQREQRLQAFTASLLVRIDGGATGRLPVLGAELMLAPPTCMRARMEWLLGTALDLCACDDSLLAWVPSQRLGLRLAHAADSLGVREPVRWFACALGATWRPPASAWAAMTQDSAGPCVRWAESSDSLALVLDSEARPSEVRLVRGASVLRVRYTDWERWERGNRRPSASCTSSSPRSANQATASAGAKRWKGPSKALPPRGGWKLAAA